MTDFQINKGEDFSFMAQVGFSNADTSNTLDDFEAVVELSTASFGGHILAYTEADKGDVQIERREGNIIAVNVTHDLSSRLPSGVLLFGIALIHKATGVRSIAETRTVEIVDNRINKVL